MIRPACFGPISRPAWTTPAVASRIGPAGGAASPGGSAGTPGTQIDVRSLSKTFTAGARRVAAVQDVSFSVKRGTTHALVGALPSR
jgi:ABC-type glutathione transport system ATPase component